MLQHTLLISFLFGIVLLYHQAESCNEAVCGSIVSKCLLTQSCKCDLQNCTCCKECFNCLSYLYSECCSCVDMCPKPKDTENRLSKNSHVEDLPEAVNVGGLFKLLTEEQDNIGRWYSISYPVDYNLSHIGVQKEAKLALQSIEQEVVSTKPNFITLNCTVAYMTQCMSWVKCKRRCETMGASSYRWFHDGCCECVGENCINYGINESRCRECSLNEDIEITDADYDHTEEFYDEDDDNTMKFE